MRLKGVVCVLLSVVLPMGAGAAPVMGGDYARTGGLSVGGGVARYQDEFGFGLSLVSAYFANRALAVKLVVAGAGAVDLWLAVLGIGLPLAVHGEDLATYLRQRENEWRALLAEGALAASREYAAAVDGDESARTLLGTSGELGWVRGAAKALPWRNGALALFGRRHAVPTPVNDRLLRAAGHDPDAV